MIEILLAIEGRDIILGLQENASVTDLKREFIALCSDDDVLAARLDQYVPTFKLFNAKFGKETELLKSHKFKDAQAVNVCWVAKTLKVSKNLTFE